MRILRKAALVILVTVFAVSMLADAFAPIPYSLQFRESICAPASRQFPLGTDELGRDRWSRLLYGTRVSLLLAPGAAIISTAMAVLVGGVAGYMGGWWDRVVLRLIDLFLSIPWLFLFLITRALLPLNTAPIDSMLVTFAVMGLLGWAGPARVIRIGAQSLRNSDMILHAQACGCNGVRLILVHMIPNLKPVVLAQFWTSIPIFILGEASLGLIGLGVAEPLPSWGNLLRDLGNPHLIATNPWVLAPLGLLVMVMTCFQFVLPRKESFA